MYPNVWSLGADDSEVEAGVPNPIPSTITSGTQDSHFITSVSSYVIPLASKNFRTIALQYQWVCLIISWLQSIWWCYAFLDWLYAVLSQDQLFLDQMTLLLTLHPQAFHPIFPLISMYGRKSRVLSALKNIAFYECSHCSIKSSREEIFRRCAVLYLGYKILSGKFNITRK